MSAQGPGLPDRAGLQPERTALAWQRTSITSIVSLVALIVIAVRLGDEVLVVLFSAAAVGGAWLVAGARRRMTALRDDATVGSTPSDAIARIAGVCCLVALCAAMTGVRLFVG